MSVSIAFYKGKATGISDVKDHILDTAIRIGTHGDYSHCEMAIDVGNGLYSCMSSSPRDGGVRQKVMPLPSDRWDLIPVDISVSGVLEFYAKQEGRKYDWAGIATFLLPFVNRFHGKDKLFCSEYCATNLGLPKPHRYSPNSLAKYLLAKAAVGVVKKAIT